MRDAHVIEETRLGIVLNELRLLTIKTLWPQSAEQADREGWPAARSLSAIAKHELAERAHRSVEGISPRHLPPGKTLDSFAFDAVPRISKAGHGNDRRRQWLATDAERPSVNSANEVDQHDSRQSKHQPCLSRVSSWSPRNTVAKGSARRYSWRAATPTEARLETRSSALKAHFQLVPAYLVLRGDASW